MASSDRDDDIIISKCFVNRFNALSTNQTVTQVNKRVNKQMK